MTASIPASQLVSIQPGVIGAGGSPLSLNGVMLTNSPLIPIGAVIPFSTAEDVGTFFGASSTEATLASVYFLGFDNSTVKPGTLYFAQYPAANVAAWLRGGSLQSMTLAQLQALSGSLSVTIDGTVKTASSINLSGVASFSAAATLIGTALGAAVTWNATLYAFQITSGTTGASSTIGYASGTLSAGLLLTAATGATTSQGSVAAAPATFMPTVTAATQNWATFFTTFEPTISEATAFAVWTNSTNNRYAYVSWDTDAAAKVSGDTSNFGAIVKAAGYNGTFVQWGGAEKAAFISGAAASIDFTRTNGRITFAYKGQSGLSADVTDATVANNLIANGYNFYGAYATANDRFVFEQPGQIAGDWLWFDAYINQIQLNNALQLAILSLFAQVNSVPYNDAGYDLIRAACQDPIDQALDFGTIRKGVPLSASQAAQVNMQAGVKIDDVLYHQGYYLQINAATAIVRGQRASPPCTLWYMDGGSVQKLNLASIDII